MNILLKEPEKYVIIDYTNHAGVRGWRTVMPISVGWGNNKWHPEQQWLMTALDISKDEIRTFAMNKIHKWSRIHNWSVKAYAGAKHYAARYGDLLLHTTHADEHSKDIEVSIWKERMARGECSKIEIINLETNDIEIIK